MTPSHSCLDARAAQPEALARLRDALRLATIRRDVAEWLYRDNTCTQGILSPQNFERSASVSTLQSVTDLAVPLSERHALPEYSEDLIHELYVPFEEVNGVALGYSFHSVLPKRGSSLVSSDLFESMKLVHGRYAYQRDASVLIVFRNAVKTDVILYIEWVTDRRRSVHYFVVPHRQYCCDDPPRVVICYGRNDADFLCFSSPEHEGGKIVTTEVSDISSDEDALPNGAADFVDGDWREDNINTLPECMFQNLNDQRESHHCQESSWLKAQQTRSFAGRYTKGMIEFTRRGRCFREIATLFPVLCGTFFSAHVIRDSFDESGALSTRLAFEVRTRVAPSDSRCSQVLIKAASQLYYSLVLWASTDQRLVTRQERYAAELLWGRSEEDGS